MVIIDFTVAISSFHLHVTCAPCTSLKLVKHANIEVKKLLYLLTDTVNFLGISIVGQTNKGGDGGIYVGSIMKGFVINSNVFSEV
jgi:hypothetical protein